MTAKWGEVDALREGLNDDYAIFCRWPATELKE